MHYFFLLVFGISCNSKENSQKIKPSINKISLEDSQVMYCKAPIDKYDYASLEKEEIPKEKIITKTAKFEIKKNDLKSVKVIIDSLNKKFGIDVVKERLSDDNYGASYTFSLNIPSKNFDAFIKEIDSKYSRIISKSIYVDDFTDSYYDTEGRLKSKKAYRDKCLEIVKMATKISDIMEIEEKINDIELEIEEMESSMKSYYYKVLNYYVYLDFRTDSKAAPIAEAPGFFSRIWQSIKAGFESGIDLIIGIFSIWHILLIILVIFIVIKKAFKKWRTNRKV